MASTQREATNYDIKDLNAISDINDEACAKSFGNKAFEFDEVSPNSTAYNRNSFTGYNKKEVEREVDSLEKAEKTRNMTIEQEKRGIMKNVIIICIAFMLLFTAFQSMSALQSSINKVDGLGTWSNTAIYASLISSSMLLPSYIIKKLTVKWTLPVCMFCYSIYICTQFYPEFYTIIPSSILVGFAAAPLWIAKCTYLTQLGEKYAHLTSVDVEPIIVKFFGIFFLFFQSSSVWGNLISSLVLRSGNDGNKTEVNVTLCGIHYCPDTPLPEDNFSISHTQLYTLAGTYLVCSVLAWIFVAILLDPLSKYIEDGRTDSSGKRKEDKTTLTLLKATTNHMLKPYQLLIIPLTIWSGIEQGFFLSDFTAGYISCIFGVGEVGWVLITYGVCDSICSLSFGVIIKHTGRIPIYVLGAVINLIVIFILLTWTPEVEKEWVFFILAGMWGIADAVWQTQINALYGVLFSNDEEAAFSNYRLWESMGFLIAFILQTQVCIEAKLYVLLAVLTVGMVGYFVIELKERKKRSYNTN